ncbi:MAG: hypothetical protein AVDCRST_MAG85-2286, partial [uncultured Solirubrobacteraceae bacterium]
GERAARGSRGGRPGAGARADARASDRRRRASRRAAGPRTRRAVAASGARRPGDRPRAGSRSAHRPCVAPRGGGTPRAPILLGARGGQRGRRRHARSARTRPALRGLRPPLVRGDALHTAMVARPAVRGDAASLRLGRGVGRVHGGRAAGSRGAALLERPACACGFRPLRGRRRPHAANREAHRRGARAAPPAGGDPQRGRSLDLRAVAPRRLARGPRGDGPARRARPL